MHETAHGTWRRNALTDLVGIDLPIVLGAFGGASSAESVAAVSNAGGLGSYGLYGMSAARIDSAVAEIRTRTSRPFALNLWLPLGDDGSTDEDRNAPDPARRDEYLAPLLDYFTELGLRPPELPERVLPTFDEQFEAVLAARPAALSTVYGVPSADVVERCHAAGIVVIGTATTDAEALALQAGGVDAIVASGMEAAGHRVSFLRAPEESLVGTMALVPRVVDTVRVPVIAAGGIADGRGVAAAFMLGAQAAQLGTAFLACDESGTNAAHRAALWGAGAADTVITRAYSARASRGIPNRMSREIDDRPAAPFPLQGWLTGVLKAEAARQGRDDLMSLWAGQGAPLIRHHTAPEVVASIVREVDALLGDTL